MKRPLKNKGFDMAIADNMNNTGVGHAGPGTEQPVENGQPWIFKYHVPEWKVNRTMSLQPGNPVKLVIFQHIFISGFEIRGHANRPLIQNGKKGTLTDHTSEFK